MKKGITAISVAIMITIIFILLGTITVSSYNSIQNAKKIVFALEISNIQEETNSFLESADEDVYPILNEVFKISIDNVSSTSEGQFADEEIDADGNITLYELDLDLIGIEDIQYGRKTTSKDIYVFSKETGKVYYLEGIKFGSKTYYTLTQDLIDIKEKNEKNDNGDDKVAEECGISTGDIRIKTLPNGEFEAYIVNIKITGENIKMAKYETGHIDKDIAKEYFQVEGTSINGDRIKLGKGTKTATVYVENTSGEYEVKHCYPYPEIPDGFVASSIETEDEVDEGLVIYEGTTAATDADSNSNGTIDAQETRNQFVWVPVLDMEQFILRDGYSNGQIETYVAKGDVTEPATTVSYYDQEAGADKHGVTLSETNDLTGEHAEYKAMKESVGEHEGFYIGRYEAGTTTMRKNLVSNWTPVNVSGNPDVFIQKNKYSYNFVGWGPSMIDTIGDIVYRNSEVENGIGAVELSRGIYPESKGYGVISTLCYGVQWDAAIDFMKDIKNPYGVNSQYYIYDSRNMGWYKNNYSKGNPSKMTGIDLNVDLDDDGIIENYATNRVKNIYDMAGNIMEWTMEKIYNWGRTPRGFSFYHSSETYSVSSRAMYVPDSSIYDTLGFRVALYLK